VELTPQGKKFLFGVHQKSPEAKSTQREMINAKKNGLNTQIPN
jgi:hypothetical protein